MRPARLPSGRGPALFRRQPVWGEGFAADDWSAMAAVSSWDVVDPDEYLRFFPRLVPRDGQVPEAVRERIACFLRDDAGSSRRVLDASRLPEAEAVRDLALRLTAADNRDAVVAPANANVQFASAFLLGVHPAYLWPLAAIAPATGTSAGWLGVVARGRPALMPAEVVESLAEWLSLRPGVRHPQLDRFVDLAAGADVLRTAVRASRSGSPALVQPRPTMDRWRRLLPAWLSTAPGRVYPVPSDTLDVAHP